jgi:hypothetical protein
MGQSKKKRTIHCAQTGCKKTDPKHMPVAQRNTFMQNPNKTTGNTAFYDKPTENGPLLRKNDMLQNRTGI